MQVNTKRKTFLTCTMDAELVTKSDLIFRIRDYYPCTHGTLIENLKVSFIV